MLKIKNAAKIKNTTLLQIMITQNGPPTSSVAIFDIKTFSWLNTGLLIVKQKSAL